MKLPTPLQRLRRMRRSFAKDQSIIVDDYEHFITPDTSTPDASTPPNRAAHTSAAPRAPRVPKRS